MTVRADSSVATESFVAAHPVEDFVRTGFASEDGKTRTYFEPDAELLLSEQFAAAYCLWNPRLNECRGFFAPGATTQSRKNRSAT